MENNYRTLFDDIKITFLLFVVLSFFSCDPFSRERVLNYEKELIHLSSKIEHYPNGSYDRDEMDEFIIDDIRDFGIDYIVKNMATKNPSYDGFIESNDSLIIHIKKAGSIFSSEKRIIYDFKNKPRNFGNQEVVGASYSLTQLSNRWYYAEVGFD